MTPDDMGYTATEGPAAAQPRARQSVVLEVGMLLSAFGRTNVAMLKRGPVDVPSDAQGIIYLAFEKHVKEVVPRLVARLREAGFDLDPDKITDASSWSHLHTPNRPSTAPRASSMILVRLSVSSAVIVRGGAIGRM